MEDCLKTHFYSEETYMANWTVCETVCLCESDDLGAPVCPEFWIIKTLCFDVLMAALQSLLNSTSTTWLTTPATTTPTTTTTTTTTSTTTTTTTTTTTPTTTAFFAQSTTAVCKLLDETVSC
jgi:hypothetical protein